MPSLGGSDPYDLARFSDAQDGMFEQACAELRAGRKVTHWMWFVFPQIKGLGLSATARRFAIRSLAEARAYLGHPLLGSRLTATTGLVLGVPDRTLHQIFGTPDDLKFRSSMTLFEVAAGRGCVFCEAIERMCGGSRDEATLALLAAEG
ncbi:MAG: DUF1810 domain-containing protein [Hyphomicrobiaceae bacterium]|nr:DUF1810 domain-containing protein [Hyphomicrobiaceae bacterium]